MRRIIRCSLVVLFAATSALWSADGARDGEAGHGVVYTAGDFAVSDRVRPLLELALQNVPVPEGQTLATFCRNPLVVPADIGRLLEQEPERQIPWLVRQNPAIERLMVETFEKIVPVLQEAQRTPVPVAAMEVWLKRVLTHGLKYNKDSQKAFLEALLHAALNKDEPRFNPLILPLVYAGADTETRDRLHRETPLIRAARNGHTEVVRGLLDVGADTKACDRHGNTPLHEAALNNDLENIQVLLVAKADPNAADRGGNTPLLWAARNGNNEIVQTLLAAKANPKAKDRGGCTPLILAARNGHTATVGVLLEAGADPNVADRDGYTPLLWAARNADAVSVEALLKANADPNVQARYGDTPLLLAAMDVRIEALLRDAGAKK